MPIGAALRFRKEEVWFPAAGGTGPPELAANAGNGSRELAGSVGRLEASPGGRDVGAVVETGSIPPAPPAAAGTGTDGPRRALAGR